ncbi:MAG TPA: hypothetical protein DCE48_16045 [Lachnospiraceae bacterium]|uniref:hypothetical protein n=1 Tax=Anaerosporobacter sp. TaxID=1872529 RepID=UPI000ED037A8|nr:hypothetical protein [Anaerosporobacter sp.]HAB62176.1 hypothetical protein [Lachnospiraceae bacterium]
MRTKLLAIILAGMLVGMNTVPVLATEIETQEIEQENDKTTDNETSTGNESNLVDVDVIDLSIHSETSGDFSAVYSYENPFKGKDTSQGVILEFYAKPTWEVHELGTIFAFNGSGEYEGKLYFTPGSYLGFNSAGFGGYFDANLFNYTIVKDYIKDGAKIRIEILPSGFSVYSNDELCYDQTILDNPEAGAGDFTSTSDFSGILTWIAGADMLYLGYGSWWNAVGTNEANINLSEVNFTLKDGTVVMNQLQADKDLVESLGGSVESSNGEETMDVELAQVEVEIFDINSVEYEGESVLPVVIITVVAAFVITLVTLIIVTKKRTYKEV